MMCFMQIIAIFFHLNEIIVSVLLYANFIVSIFLIARNRSYLNYTSKIFLLNVFLIFLLFFYTILYNIFYEDMYDYMGRGGVFTITKYCYGIFAWFVIGGGLAISIKTLSVNRNFVFLTFILFLLFLFKSRGLNPLDYQDLNTDNVRVDHLVLGFFLVYLIVNSHSQAKGWWILVVFLMNALVLIMSGGRSDFFMYICSAFIFNFIFDKNKVKLATASLIIFITIFFLIFSPLFGVGITDRLDGFDRFNNLDANDSSVLARNQILIENLKDLRHEIFISDPNYLIKKHGNLGQYIHNILSAWQSYGLIFFLLISYISLSNLLFLYKHKNNLMKTRVGRFGVFIFIFCFLSILLSKSIYYYPFWFALGFIVIHRCFTKVSIAIKNV